MRGLKLIKQKNKTEGASYFDLSAKEKKAILEKAAEESNKMQQAVIDQYEALVAVA